MMKIRYTSFPLSLLACLLCVAVSCRKAKPESLVDLRPDTFELGMPGKECLSVPADGEAVAAQPGLQKAFSLRARLRLSDFQSDREVLALPGMLALRLRQHDARDIWRQNYPAGRMPDGRVPVLEAGLMLRLPDGCTPVREGQPQVQEMVVGLPLGLLAEPWGEHDLVLNFTGTTWDMYLDGRLADRDFALGYPPVPDSLAFLRDEAVVCQAALYAGAAEAVARSGAEPRRRPVQYFTPSGHNAWVGDVATIWHRGRYHVFYLLDRRGHQSKFGRGGHYFEHLSTSDFLHWTEHEPAASIEEQWETLGTGTPFVWHDSLCLAYGMHTSRIWPSELTSSPAQWQYISQQGSSRSIPFDHPFAGNQGFPSGASYCVSQDGVADFRKSHVLIHPAENPTIYTDQEGRLCMLANYAARGMWTSERLDGGWHCLSEDFPPGGDCTFLFSWGGYDYIVGGFTHLWMKRSGEDISAYSDMVARGEDFYDGLSVPSIAAIPGGRYLMAGWVEVNHHWGGPLVIRELLQYPDGRLGSRFMPELMPAAAGPSRSLARQVRSDAPLMAQANEESFLLSFSVEAQAGGGVELDFLPAGDGDSCRWTLDLARGEARFGEGRTLCEGDAPHQAGDYAIGHLLGLDKPFEVRIIVRGEAKLGGSLIDVEIAGQRTMISHRGGLCISRLRLVPRGTALRNVRLQALK